MTPIIVDDPSMQTSVEGLIAALLASRPGWSARPLGKSPYGIATFRLGGPAGDWLFLKASPRSNRHLPLQGEYERTLWAADYLPVPKVVDHGSEADFDWLMTVGIDAPDGTSSALLADPAALVRTMAAGLRRFHDAPTHACPFDFRVDAALHQIECRVAAGLADAAADFHPEHAGLSVGQALQRLGDERPEAEDLVVCHGDYTVPNVLILDSTVVAFLDLGELGVADRWWDLAVATWSITWNLGPGWEQAFLDAYGIEPDHDRLRYYRLLYDLAS